MKITISAISTFFKRLRSGVREDPVRDWLVMITFSAIVLTGVVVWNAWAFDTVASGGTIGAPPANTPVIPGRSSLDDIHAIFDARATEQTKYITGTYRFADPSQ